MNWQKTFMPIRHCNRPCPGWTMSPPTAPEELRITETADGYTLLTWKAAKDNDPVNAPRYVIYASETYPVDTTKPENIIAQSVRGTEYVYTSLLPWDRKKCFAVTAIDRYGNEGKAVQGR